MTLPALPQRMWSVFGWVPVMPTAGLLQNDHPCLGLMRRAQRAIEVEADAPLVVQWQALIHEHLHLALWDAGVHNVLTDEQREAVCDALATARVQEMLDSTSRRPHTARTSRRRP